MKLATLSRVATFFLPLVDLIFFVIFGSPYHSHMISPNPSKLFTDLKPSGIIESYAGDLRNSIGLDTPRLSDERSVMDPNAARYHSPRWCWQHRITIRERVATVTRQILFSPPKPNQGPKPESLKNLGNGSSKGFISRDAARRIRNIINDWAQAVNCGSSWSKQNGDSHGIYFSFCTVTLPVKQFHSDKDLKQKLLNPFLKALQRDQGLTNYLWRAEPQGNGNLHFHIFMDRFIEYGVIGSYWSWHLEHLGYITAYAEQSGSFFPPATQIIKVPRDGQLREYIAKYLSKANNRRRSILPSENGKVTRISYWSEREKPDGSIEEYEVRPIQGRVWGCSDLLRELKPFNVAISDRIGSFVNWVKDTTGTYSEVKEFGELLIGSITKHMNNFDKWLWRSFYWWHVDQFRFLYCQQPHKPPRAPDTLREILLACCAGLRDHQNGTPPTPQPIPIHTQSHQAINPLTTLNPILEIPF